MILRTPEFCFAARMLKLLVKLHEFGFCVVHVIQRCPCWNPMAMNFAQKSTQANLASELDVL